MKIIKSKRFLLLTMFLCVGVLAFTVSNTANVGETSEQNTKTATVTKGSRTYTTIETPYGGEIVTLVPDNKKKEVTYDAEGRAFVELEEPVGGWIKIPTPIEEAESGVLKATTLPSVYDARNESYNKYITIKNQGSTGMCWLFSSTTTAERCYLHERAKAGKSITSGPVYSPHQLGYFMAHPANDPLGLTPNDSTTFTPDDKGNTYLDCGGNIYMVYQELVQWKGFSSESNMPVQNAEYKSADSKLAFDNSAIIENGQVYFNKTEVKQAVQKYGAITVALNQSQGTMNNTYHSYYCPANVSPNHQVTIVGWDDNFDRSKFSGSTPSGDGAWIIQNSWGPTWGDQGYYYVSYYDKSICDFASIDIQETSTYDYNYHYDGNGSYVSYMHGNPVGTAYTHEYTVKNDDQILKAVGVTLREMSGANKSRKIKVRVFTNIKTASNPASGTLAAEFEATINYNEGVSTIKIPSDKKIYLTKGSKFAVSIEQLDSDFSMYITRNSDNGYFKHVNGNAENTIFIGQGKSNFRDVVASNAVGDKTVDFKIKAFTVSDKASTEANKYTPKLPKTKIEVVNTASLTDAEKQAVKEAVSTANAGYLPEGVTISVDSTGKVTITYSDSSKDTIAATSVVTKKKTMAEKYTPKLPTESKKISVSDNANLTSAEIDKIKNLLSSLNATPTTGITISEITVNKDGSAVVLYSDGSKDNIAAKSLVKVTTPRLSGATRYETSRSVASQIKKLKGGARFNAIILAYGQNFPDALGAGILSKAYDAPIIMVNVDQEAETIKYVKSNLVETGGEIFLLGGTGVISTNLETQLKKFAKVTRLGGADRFDTNNKILSAVEKSGKAEIKRVIVCTSDNFADSLSASATGYPVIIARGSLTSANLQFIKKYSSATYYLIGGPAVVPESIATQIKNITKKNPSRIYGADRFETSKKIVSTFFKNAPTLVLTYGYNFPDGLSGGPLCQTLNAPLLLVAPGKESLAKSVFTQCKASRLYTLGGTALINNGFTSATIK